MNGLYIIALKLLANDKGKFFTLIVGVSFAVFLMMQMTCMFSGLMRRTGSDILNINAKMWVMDPSLNSQSDNIPMPDYILDAVRSIKGVKYAVPLYTGGGLAKLSDGRYQAVNIRGLDDATLFGRPQMLSGDIINIYNDDAYIAIKDSEFEKLDNAKVGTTFEVNDHRGVIVGIGKALVGGLFGTPTLYTTYRRAIAVLPHTRFTLSFILVEPKSEADVKYIQKEVKKLNYVALTKDEFFNKNRDYYLYKTGLGTNVMIMTIISFIVGLSIAGQTFYTFVIENLQEFGALKAIGAKKKELISIILFQSAVVGFLGYGFGIFLSSTVIALAKLRLHNYAAQVTLENMFLTFLMVLVIVAFSSYLGVRKVITIDPFDIFRG
ncbi:MAG: ABC transporter permease [Gammaproteobacteria bacterium]